MTLICDCNGGRTVKAALLKVNTVTKDCLSHRVFGQGNADELGERDLKVCSMLFRT